jgi:hypothetical protein
MHKLRLTLEDLCIDSFDTTPAARERGTVVGQQYYTRYDTHCPTWCLEYPTCADDSCGGTCPWKTCADTCAYTCAATCAFTCDDDTCYISCHGTCEHTCLCPLIQEP